MRSKWKGVYLNPNFLLNSENNLNKNVQLCSRNSVITSDMLGKTLSVHNGRNFMPISIKNGMIGYKLGSFVFTKRTGNRIHVKKTKKRR